jgi:hypothetical protein
LALGTAILAGVVVALAASPAIKSLEPVATLSVPSQRLHIAPPDFAASVALPTPSPAEPAARLMKAPHPKRVVRSTKVIAIEPPPAVAIAIRPLAAPLAIPEQAVLAPPPAEPDAPQAAPQPKKTFWGKINVFKKKKNADPPETSK